MAKQAYFSPEVEYVGEMIIEDAQRLLALHDQIKRMETKINGALETSPIGQIILSIPGYGPICSAELAGVVAR